MNLGSKFNKVKQQASLFLRGDKTDVIGTLKDAEDKVDELRILSDAISRSLEKRLYTYNVTDEKKLGKLPETQVSEIIREGLKDVSNSQSEQMDKSLFRCVVEEAMSVEKLLANILIDYEDEVTKEILPFLRNLLKEDFPSLAKQKKALKQAGQDLDASKARLRSSISSNQGHAKVDNQKYEVDEAETKLEQIKDSYACDLFTTMSHEREIARLTCLNMEIKLDFLQRSVVALKTLLPPIQKLFTESDSGPVYSVVLHDHLTITQRKIALPIETCIKRLIESGLKEEGLFRVAGSATKIKRLRSAFDAGIVSYTSLCSAGREYDVHVIAGTLKSYLRELPEPLLTHVRHDQWTDAANQTDHDERLKALWQVTASLPEQNYQNLAYIMKFLSMLAKYSSINKMTANNLAIVMAPNLIWKLRDSKDLHLSTLGRNMTLTNDYRIIVEQMIEYCSYFFKDEVDFGVQPIFDEIETDNERCDGTTSLKVQSHKRNNSSELGFLGYHDEIDLDSPRQPHRNKKKPAPKPPALKKTEHQSADNSPNLRRSHSPTAIPTHRGKSPYNNVRRPTEEPPPPPSQGVIKPPRPQLPSNYDSELKSNVDKEDAIGGLQHANDLCKLNDNIEEDDDIVDESVSLRESTAVSSEFRKSLEGFLKHPQPLPRHLTKMSCSYPESGTESSHIKLGLPVAAQRSFRKNASEKVELAIADKPMIAEKPNLMQKPNLSAENCRPLIPGKPIILAPKAQTKSNEDETATACKNKSDATHL